MLRSLHFEAGFEETHQATNLRVQSAQPTAPSSWRTARALRMIWDALHGGLAAYRQYEHLRSRSVPHDTAIREALGIRKA
jgi:hypothetical protein